MEPSPGKTNTKFLQQSPHAAIYLTSELPIIQANLSKTQLTSLASNLVGEWDKQRKIKKKKS